MTQQSKIHSHPIGTHSLTYSPAYSLTHSLAHIITYSPAYSLLLTHSLTHSLLLTHFLTHLLTHLPRILALEYLQKAVTVVSLWYDTVDADDCDFTREMKTYSVKLWVVALHLDNYIFDAYIQDRLVRY